MSDGFTIQTDVWRDVPTDVLRNLHVNLNVPLSTEAADLLDIKDWWQLSILQKSIESELRRRNEFL